MLEAAADGLVSLFAWPAFGLMLAGIGIGFVVGLLPGLGGVTALVLMMPFTFSMQPIEAFAFLLGMFVVASNTGELTSILFGVPGEGTTAATIVDGHPMAQRGEAGRAMGASLTSSGVGAVIGAVVLAASIPIVRPLVLTFASPELFALTVLGVTFIAALSSNSLDKGILMGGFGFLLATVGQSPQTGFLRFTFSQTYLFDGVSLIPVALGLFAIPEIIDLAVRGTSIADRQVGKIGGVLQGVRDTFAHIWLVARCGGISAFVGLIPGLGSAAAQWVSYAHAVQSSPRPEEFGTGRVEGVLAPGASANSKEGGALIPTVAFGVPGSFAMAILLGAFLMVGLIPGPNMLTTNLNVTFSLVWILVVSNFISIGIAFLFLNQLAKITTIKGTLLIPVLLSLVWLGAFSASSNFGDLIALVIFGAVGVAMVRLDWPRPPLVLGLVLGGLTDVYLFRSVDRYGSEFLYRPVVAFVLMLAVASLVYALIQGRRLRARRGAEPPLERSQSFGELGFNVLLAAIFAFAVVTGIGWRFRDQLFPLAIAGPMLVLAFVPLVRTLRGILAPQAATLATAAAAGASAAGGATTEAPQSLAERAQPIAEVAPEAYVEGRQRRFFQMIGWVGVSFLWMWLIGFREGLPTFVFLFLLFQSKEKLWLSVLIAVATGIVLHQFFGNTLHYPWPEPQVAIWLDFDWPGM